MPWLTCLCLLGWCSIKSLSSTFFFPHFILHSHHSYQWLTMAMIATFCVLSKPLHNWSNCPDPRFLQSNHPLLVEFTFCGIISFLKQLDWINVWFPIEPIELASLVRFLKPWSNLKMFSFDCKTFLP